MPQPNEKRSGRILKPFDMSISRPTATALGQAPQDPPAEAAHVPPTPQPEASNDQDLLERQIRKVERKAEVIGNRVAGTRTRVAGEHGTLTNPDEEGYYSTSVKVPTELGDRIAAYARKHRCKQYQVYVAAVEDYLKSRGF